MKNIFKLVYGKSQIFQDISDRISFGKKPLKRELERLEKISGQNQVNNFNDQSQMNGNINNYINNFNNVNQINFQKLIIYTKLLNEQIFNQMNFNNLSLNNNNIQNNFCGICTNDNVQRDYLLIPKNNYDV